MKSIVKPSIDTKYGIKAFWTDKHLYRHLHHVNLQHFRSWNLPKELRDNKEFINLLNQYTLAKESLDAKIREAINKGHIKDISKCCERRISSRPKLDFKTVARQVQSYAKGS